MRSIITVFSIALPIFFMQDNPAIAALSTFSDSTFDETDWNVTSIANDTGGGNVSVEQISPGGNPGEYRKVTNFVEIINSGERSSILGFHEFPSAVYDPALGGEVASLGFSIDYMNIDVTGNGQRVGLALKQDGQVFGAEFTFTTAAGKSLNFWQSPSLKEFVIGDFFRVDSSLNALRDPSVQPDFSASGSPMVFGFHTFNTVPPTVPVGTSDTLIVGYDNWEVTVRVVPEPSAIALMACGQLLLCRWSRRWQRATDQLR